MGIDPGHGQAAMYERPVELLRRLIRFDTTNPPGREAECILYIKSLLEEAGCTVNLLARDAKRPNLICRLPGEGKAPPLLLYGHVDVVTTAGQSWRHPPFEGVIADGCVWGRGALDMKAGVAMMLAAFLRARSEGATLPGDVILAVLSDEENGGDYGAAFLVENHASLFDGVRYAIGEIGGFSLAIAGRRLYPIAVAEKQMCWLRAVVRGPGGHGAMPARGGAMAALGKVLAGLDRHNMPIHVVPPVARMVQSIADVLPVPAGALLRQLANPGLAGVILGLLGGKGELFVPLFHNTVNATIVRGGDKINVIPSEVFLEMDGRLLPGFGPADLIAELRGVIGNDVEVEVVRHDPGPAEPDMGLFATLRGILRETDPDGAPVPFVLPAVTDGRHFSRLGIQTYGFTPMLLPDVMNFSRLAHGADERIPVEALAFGTEAIYKLLTRFNGGSK